MSSDQKPETWGYGLTWLITIGLIGMIGFGVVKLRAVAKTSHAKLSAAKEEADGLAAEHAQKESEKIQKMQEIEEAGPQPTADDIAKGQVKYAACAACHGPGGSGSMSPQAIKAPNLAGADRWYTQSQIQKIKDGVRGTPADMEVTMMKASVMNLSDEDIFQISAYLESLKKVAPKHLLSGGDVAKGKAAFAACAACHGANGEGNRDKAILAPALNNLPDWYIVNQLNKFKSGVRGAHPKDEKGQQMAGQAKLLKDDQAIKDLVEYIKTLK